MQKLGQHFLKNRSAVAKIIEALDVCVGDTIIEIGPGHGELTLPLVQSCIQKNVRLIAIERDEELGNELRSKLSELKIENAEITTGDVLEIVPSLATKTETAKYKLVGNIPYYLTGHLLRIVDELKPQPERCVFMVQKEVAERIVATPPQMNRLAASIQIWGEPKIIARISRRDFAPPPKVDSAVVLMKTKTKSFPTSTERYYAAMRALFAQPRKTILNNLSHGVEVAGRENEGKKTGEKKDIEARIREIGIDPGARPQNLSIENIVSIAELLF